MVELLEKLLDKFPVTGLKKPMGTFLQLLLEEVLRKFMKEFLVEM